MKAVYRLLTQLSSRKSVSKLTGRIAKSSVSKHFIGHFAKTYHIQIDEAEKKITDYHTLNDFFTRRLKKGARTIDLHPQTVVSPVDALITGIGKIENGSMCNIKGQDYQIVELLGNKQKAEDFEGGTYLVLYLSPRDYHRIHVPISGQIVEHVHLPGKVYPVNDFGLVYMNKVLSRNERLITYIQHQQVEVAVIKVGALNVASIKLSDQLQSKHVEKGDELAYFEFGSTVVLCINDPKFSFDPHIQLGSRVKMGQSLGKLL